MKNTIMQKLFNQFAVCMIVINAAAQQRTISGKVTDDKGFPLVGATILEKKSNKGTSTKEDGSFSITVSNSNIILVISYVGYETKEVALNNRSNITVTLIPSVSSLNDVVVIGYGMVKKKDLTGAVASVQEKDFNKGSYTSPDR
jgi:iron complex outermembrane receptor protein